MTAKKYPDLRSALEAVAKDHMLLSVGADLLALMSRHGFKVEVDERANQWREDANIGVAPDEVVALRTMLIETLRQVADTLSQIDAGGYYPWKEAQDRERATE